ncbi:hypothetical protein PtB15_2B23 [Puccinia triticina]|nr:hypothetical protein PtB15_2B23 [Puccinia triticina]
MYVPAGTRAASAASDINHAAGAKVQESGLLAGNLRKSDTPPVIPEPKQISREVESVQPKENVLQGPPSKPAGQAPKNTARNIFTQALRALQNKLKQLAEVIANIFGGFRKSEDKVQARVIRGALKKED